MEKKTPKKKDTININLLFSETKMRLLTVFSTNLVLIALFLGVGYLIDVMFDTKPMFMFIMMVLSFPTAIYAQFKQAKKITDKIKKKHNG